MARTLTLGAGSNLELYVPLATPWSSDIFLILSKQMQSLHQEDKKGNIPTTTEREVPSKVQKEEYIDCLNKKDPKNPKISLES